MRSLLHIVALVSFFGGACSFVSPAEPPAEPVLSTNGAQQERHLVEYSNSARPEQRLPMLVLVHGYGGTPDKMLASFGTINVPTRIVSLRGKSNHRRGFYWFPVDVENPDVPQLATDLRRVGEDVATELAALTARYPTKGQPVVLGFSQGAMIALELGLQHPERLATAVVVAGYYPPQLFPKKEAHQPRAAEIFAIHGTVDDVLPIGHMREAVEAIRQSSIDVDYREYEGMGHGVEGLAHRQVMRLLERELREQEN